MKTNVGFLLNLKGPPGEKGLPGRAGIDGIPGEKGEHGDQGISGKQLKFSYVYLPSSHAPQSPTTF